MRLLTAWWSRRRTPRGFPLGMTVPPANPPRPGGIIASWSGTAYSTRQVWLISQLTSISEGLSPIRHPGTRLVGDGHPTTELEVAYSRLRCTATFIGETGVSIWRMRRRRRSLLADDGTKIFEFRTALQFLAFSSWQWSFSLLALWCSSSAWFSCCWSPCRSW